VSVTTVTVQHVGHATPRTRVLRLDLGSARFPFTAGQAVMAGLHGSPLRKPYSIASAPGEVARSHAIELLVQLDETGGPDPHLELATSGTALDLEGPFGTFALPSSPDDTYLLVAGGTGIAPLRSMLFDALERLTRPRLSVLYSAREEREFAYRADLERLAAGGQIRLFLTVTRENGGTWAGRRGRIDRALLEAALPSPDALCLLCGPPSLVSDTRERLRELGVSDGAIVVEQYQ
jgi:ferredoxin-NADP reductase